MASLTTHIACQAVLVYALKLAFCNTKPTDDAGQVTCFNRTCSWAPFLPHAGSRSSKCHVHLRLGDWVICRTARRHRVSDIGLVGSMVQHWTGSAEAAAPLLSPK